MSPNGTKPDIAAVVIDVFFRGKQGAALGRPG